MKFSQQVIVCVRKSDKPISVLSLVEQITLCLLPFLHLPFQFIFNLHQFGYPDFLENYSRHSFRIYC